MTPLEETLILVRAQLPAIAKQVATGNTNYICEDMDICGDSIVLALPELIAEIDRLTAALLMARETSNRIGHALQAEKEAHEMTKKKLATVTPITTKTAKATAHKKETIKDGGAFVVTPDDKRLVKHYVLGWRPELQAHDPQTPRPEMQRTLKIFLADGYYEREDPTGSLLASMDKAMAKK